MFCVSTLMASGAPHVCALSFLPQRIRTVDSLPDSLAHVGSSSMKSRLKRLSVSPAFTLQNDWRTVDLPIVNAPPDLQGVVS